MILPEINHRIERPEQNDALNSVRIFAGEIRGDTCAQRFTDQVNGALRREMFERLSSTLFKSRFGWFARTIRVAGILHHEHVERFDLLNGVSETTAPDGATRVAMQDKHLTRCRLNR